MEKLSLNSSWRVTMEELSVLRDDFSSVASKVDGWYSCSLPCDVHMPLIENGVIEEPLVGLNCYDAEWTADKSWWFMREILITPELLEHDALELTFEALDCMADIFINDAHVAFHESAFYPFNMDVKKHLHLGVNVLLVRLSSGLDRVDFTEIEPMLPVIFHSVDELNNPRSDVRRVRIRKAQYAYGWDWGPKVSTCGIVGDAYITAFNRVAVRNVHIVTESITNDAAVLNIIVEAENFHVFKSFDANIKLDIAFNGENCVAFSKKEHLRGGLNFLKYKITVDSPFLWWPNGMGEPNLYDLSVNIISGAKCSCLKTAFGIRTLCVDMDELDDANRLFAFRVNGIRIYSKGSNWVPADSIYARITDEKYDILVSEAKDANFNMLRVWGGGIYEPEAFYNACDRYGILVWQDFMFSCGLYPDFVEKFSALVEKELDYQTKRLRNHPSLAIFSGSNENVWICTGSVKTEVYAGHYIYSTLMPLYIERNCPKILYWNSSPYGGEDPNGSEVGDCHSWGDLSDSPTWRCTLTEYDKIDAKFVSEYGYMGPCSLSTIEKYHGGASVDRGGDIWKLHTNIFEKGMVKDGINKHYSDSEELSLEEYILYGGLCQGLVYQYSLEAIRFKRNCWGSLFWMYNDCWGEVGWTIIDYYLKRKPSYYFVRRTYSPVKLIVREVESGIATVACINDTAASIVLPIEYGYVSFDGALRLTKKTEIALPAFTRIDDFTFNMNEMDKMGDCDALCGVWFVRDLSNQSPDAVLFKNYFKDLIIPKPVISIKDFFVSDSCITVTVESSVFCHAVHFESIAGLASIEECDFSDLYFDMLPNECRTVQIFDAPAGLTASDLKVTAVHLS